MNLFPELIAGDGGTAAEQWILKRSPGAYQFLTVAGTIRGMFVTRDRVFVVADFTLYEIQFQAGLTFIAVNRGTLTTFASPKPVLMRATAVELFIVADLAGYVYNISTFTFTKVTAAAFPVGASTLAMIDTYFIVATTTTGAVSNQFSISGALNGLSWSALDFGSSQEPDTIIGLAELHQNLWIFGKKRVVVYQNTGAASFPFQRVPGAAIDIGLASPWSIQNVDNTLFWLGSNENGSAVVYRADGLLPTRVSNHALEYAMQTYPYIYDAVSSTYQEEGHLFYRLDFPSANQIGSTQGYYGATWLYDVSTKRWHQRGLWDSVNSVYYADPARYHCNYLNWFHVVGDYRSGALYLQSQNYADWAGTPIRWVRRAPHIFDSERRVRIAYRSFEVLLGVRGLVAAPVPMTLKWSDDEGASWPLQHSMTHQTPGDYNKRIVFRQLGAARSRIFELSGSDALGRLSIVGVELQIEKGSS